MTFPDAVNELLDSQWSNGMKQQSSEMVADCVAALASFERPVDRLTATQVKNWIARKRKLIGLTNRKRGTASMSSSQRVAAVDNSSAIDATASSNGLSDPLQNSETVERRTIIYSLRQQHLTARNIHMQDMKVQRQFAGSNYSSDPAVRGKAVMEHANAAWDDLTDEAREEYKAQAKALKDNAIDAKTTYIECEKSRNTLINALLNHQRDIQMTLANQGVVTYSMARTEDGKFRRFSSHPEYVEYLGKMSGEMQA